MASSVLDTGPSSGLRLGVGAVHLALSEGKRAQGEVSAGLIRRELEKVREEGGSGAYGVFGEQRIAAALKRLGCGKEHGVYIGNGFYSVHTGVVCVSGYVKKDERRYSCGGGLHEGQRNHRPTPPGREAWAGERTESCLSYLRVSA
ncbi:hypothetical protein ACIOKD_12185 [Streptomyces sp. NPDC087844]|uniref:hypothetical protein n=1 Tax=Streptomyces sp. NPDC087844 TaxID=3365805 RepID=UPI003813AE43